MTKDFFELLEANQKIDEDIIFLIFNDKVKRRIFINDYKYFSKNDKNRLAEYIEDKFINDLNNNFKIDLLDLSCEINYFNERIYKSIYFEVKKKNNYLFKLAVIDYINKFYFIINNKKNYVDLNYFLFSNSRNDLIIFQSAINLLVSDEGFYKTILLKKMKSDRIEPYCFYRLVNTLTDYKQFEYFSNFLNEVLKSINFTRKLSTNQKEELKNKIISYLN